MEIIGANEHAGPEVDGRDPADGLPVTGPGLMQNRRKMQLGLVEAGTENAEIAATLLQVVRMVALFQQTGGA